MPFQRQAGQTKRARFLRQQDSPAEVALWTVLKNRQLGEHKFVRQLPIGRYYADFVCRAASLVVEVDGSQHVDSKSDRLRDGFMLQLGYGVLRIPSMQVLHRRDNVCDTILAILDGRLTQNVDTLDMKFTPPSSVTLRAPPSPASGRSDDLSPLHFSRQREKL